MDNETLIVVALVRGASEGGKEATSSPVRDAYQALKGLVRGRLAHRPEAQTLLDENDGREPDAWKEALLEALAGVRAADDAEIVHAARRVHALLGQRAVEAHGQGVVVGDYNSVFQYFAQAPSDLSTFIRSTQFRPYVDKRTEDFTGRGFALSAIQRWLDDPGFRSGYIVVQGEPGIGKTALLGQLVKQGGYVHHFNIATMQLASIAAFLSNVCAQLIVRYGLNHAALPPHAITDGGFLLGLLDEAASDPANRPVVVVVDALDEADDADAPERNPLLLPPTLPDGVFVIVSTRPRKHPLPLAPQETIDLDADPQARNDAPAYIQRVLENAGDTMHEQVARWGVSEDHFVAELTARSEGNFMYLVLVLSDILTGRLAADNIGRVEDLPKGLTAYYRRHWETMRSRNQDRFHRLEEPMVCLLGTANEPVSIDQVMNWTRHVWTTKGWDLDGLDRGLLRDVINDWYEYLNPVTMQDEEYYALYHKSFRDFLVHEVGLSVYRRAILNAAFAKIPGFRRL